LWIRRRLVERRAVVVAELYVRPLVAVERREIRRLAETPGGSTGPSREVYTGLRRVAGGALCL